MPSMLEIEAPGYIIHSRRYRDSGVILEVFFEHFGLIPVINCRISQRQQSLLSPFNPLHFNLRGKSELKYLRQVEQTGSGFQLSGKYLFSALYMNELLLKLLYRYQPMPVLFRHYQSALHSLHIGQEIEPALRGFEWQLLLDLGYGFDFQHDVHGRLIDKNSQYTYVLDEGFAVVSSNEVGIPGHALSALAVRDFRDKATLVTAKQLSRKIFTHLLNGASLKSRELFSDLVRREKK